MGGSGFGALQEEHSYLRVVRVTESSSAEGCSSCAVQTVWVNEAGSLFAINPISAIRAACPATAPRATISVRVAAGEVSADEVGTGVAVAQGRPGLARDQREKKKVDGLHLGE